MKITELTTEDEIIKNIKLLKKEDWNKISEVCNLSLSFKERYFKKLNKDNLSFFQKLEEEFIEEFENELCWCYISMNQLLSERFLKKYEKRISWFLFSSLNKGITEKIFLSFRNQLVTEQLKKNKNFNTKDWAKKSLDLLDFV
jgi:hypothetical protein